MHRPHTEHVHIICQYLLMIKHPGEIDYEFKEITLVLSKATSCADFYPLSVLYDIPGTCTNVSS
jgi:hypothetical protein